MLEKDCCYDIMVCLPVLGMGDQGNLSHTLLLWELKGFDLWVLTGIFHLCICHGSNRASVLTSECPHVSVCMCCVHLHTGEHHTQI